MNPTSVQCLKASLDLCQEYSSAQKVHTVNGKLFASVVIALDLCDFYELVAQSRQLGLDEAWHICYLTPF